MEPANALATALDDEDYLSARKLLADACVYRIRGTLIEGGDAIIASYQVNGENGRNRFDEVAYESLVSPIGPNKAMIDYTDIITVGRDRLVHRCAQEVTWDQSGLVTQIIHIDLPGEVEALEAFKRAHPNRRKGEQGVDLDA